MLSAYYEKKSYISYVINYITHMYKSMGVKDHIYISYISSRIFLLYIVVDVMNAL